MADIIFNKFLEAAIDDYLSGKTLKITLIMSNSELETAQATARDYDTLDAFMTLDECNSVTFTFAHAGDGRKTVTLTGEVDDTNDRGSMESVTGTYTWTALAAASRSITGVLFHEQGSSDDTTAVPICYYQFAVPRPADLSDFVVNFDAGSGKFIRYNQGV